MQLTHCGTFSFLVPSFWEHQPSTETRLLFPMLRQGAAFRREQQVAALTQSEAVSSTLLWSVPRTAKAW